jgi:hypothetical protein
MLRLAGGPTRAASASVYLVITPKLDFRDAHARQPNECANAAER